MRSLSLTASLVREQRLILSCVRVELNEVDKVHIGNILEPSLDWSSITGIAVHHGIEGLLHKHLSRYAAQIPRDILRFLAARALHVSARSRRQLEELLRLIAELEDRGIAVIPFKGPVLAEMIYGSAGYRSSADLDVLVQRADIPAIREYLLTQGYRSDRGIDVEDEPAFLDTQLGYDFYHSEQGIMLELHWTFFHTVLSVEFSPAQIWERHRSASCAGRQVRVLAPEDLLIYLCAHGTKHRWSKIKWLVDVAEYLRVHPDLDWSVLEQRARRVGCLRMLMLGVHLAAELLDAPVPREISRAAAGDRKVRLMARQVCTRWMFRMQDNGNAHTFANLRFRWNVRERVGDRLPYLAHSLGLWLRPSATDREWIELPRHLRFAYYILRPFRILSAAISERRALAKDPPRADS